MIFEKTILFCTSPIFFGVLIMLVFFVFLAFLIDFFPYSRISIIFDTGYEKAFNFFSSIMGEEEKMIVKSYVVILFFVILFSNLLSVVLELFSPLFWVSETGEFIVYNFIWMPSTNVNFNIALAAFSILVVLFVQFDKQGFLHFFYNFFPIFGKNYIKLSREGKSQFVYFVLFVFVKIFDILISLFLWFLEIISFLAKIISLSLRLFGNMTSWGVLLWVIVITMGQLTRNMFWLDFPIIVPVLIYLQEILVAFIQAIVFALLISVFIRVARVS